MDNSSLALFALLYIVALAFITKIINKHYQSKKKTPPGPKPWPILGNLNLVGPLPHISFHLLSQKYGELMQLWFGSFPILVVSSPEMARQFLQTHDRIFASRPALAAGKYTSYNYSDVSWAPYGPYWRQTRKILFTEVLSSKKLDFFEHIRVEERHNFLSRLRSLAGKPVLLRDHLLHYMLSTISRMVLGNKYFSESSQNEESVVVKEGELQEMLSEWLLLSGVFNIGDWIPWLAFLDLQGHVRTMKALHKRLDRFLNYVVDDHQARREANKEEFEPKDMVDTLLLQAEDPNLEIKLTKDSIKALIQNLLLGGTDTSATTVEWTIHEIIKQPLIISKAKEELDRVIGRNRWVEEDDFSRLPYIDAIIMESMRLHPLATVLAPHHATQDCNVAGYDISKGTNVLINTWSIGRDPKLWDSPNEFIPERFIGKEVDILGSNFTLLPFGSGRRRCPGYNLGLKVVRSTLANLLHGFNLKLIDGMKLEDICMEEIYGLTTPPKVPLSLKMEPTLDIPY